MSPYEFVNTNIAYVALFASILALILSGASFYFTFFHRRTSLLGIFVTYGNEAEGALDMFLEYALSNTGNVQLVLNQIMVPISRDLTRACDGLPVSIEPGTAKVVMVRLLKVEAQEALTKDQPCLTEFYFYSSRGKRYQAVHDFTSIVPEPGVPGRPSPFDLGEREVWMPFKLKRTKISR